jgi:hypothetical protein
MVVVDLDPNRVGNGLGRPSLVRLGDGFCLPGPRVGWFPTSFRLGVLYPSDMTQASEGKTRSTTSFGVVERLLAAAAVLGATIYVLMNAVYVEFYDDFGVRPEEVGWDRLAVVSRAAWIAVVGILAAGFAAWFFAILATRRMASRAPAASSQALAQTESLAVGVDRKNVEKSVASERIRRARSAILLRTAPLFLVMLMLAGYWSLTLQVEDEAERVRRGETVSGVGLFISLVDVRASPAEVRWLGEASRQPPELDAPHLMYLGRGRDIAAFVVCGRTTILVPAEDVAIHILDQGHSDQDHAAQRRRLDDVC